MSLQPPTFVSETPWERRTKLLVLTIVTIWVSLCALQSHLSVNPASRFATMEALVEHGTYAIDDTSLLSSTIDKVRWPPGDLPESKFYSSKPPLLMTLGAPAYWVWLKVTGIHFGDNQYLVASALEIAFGVVPWFAAMVLFDKFLLAFVHDPKSRVWGFVAMCAGGLLTAYAPQLDNHSLSAFSLMWGVWLAIPAVFGSRPAPAPAPKEADGNSVDAAPSAGASTGRLFAAGLLGGLAVTFDYGVAPQVGMLGLAFAYHSWATGVWRQVIPVVAGGLVAPAAQFLIQFSIAGTFTPFYGIPDAYSYEGSYWKTPSDFDALHEPRPIYVFHSILGHHGLLSSTPFLVLAFGWFRLARSRTEKLFGNAFWLAMAAMLYIYLIHNTTQNYGGRCVGMRWFLVLHPALSLLAARVASASELPQRFPILAGGLIGVSAVTALSGAINPWEEGIVYAIFRAFGLGSVDG